MTLEERVAALEAKTQDMTRTVYAGVPGLQINARIGVFTNYWLNQDIGQGAALSVGTNSDRYAIYAEIDAVSCPDHPSVAILASNLAVNASQPNHGVEVWTGNSSLAGPGGLLENKPLVVTVRDHTVVARYEGVELVGSWTAWVVGKIGGVIKQLWP